MLNKLGSDMPALDVYEGSVEDENNGTAIWGNFEQFNSIVAKLEEHVASIGETFLLPNIDITIDDDELRQRSQKFRDEGLQNNWTHRQPNRTCNEWDWNCSEWSYCIIALQSAWRYPRNRGERPISKARLWEINHSTWKTRYLRNDG
jgi:hypothetical protein